MGPTIAIVGTLHRPSARDRLRRLAAPLHPEREPYYLRVRDRPPTLRKTFPATGWYWRPADHPVAVFLGSNEFEARDELLELLRRAEAE